MNIVMNIVTDDVGNEIIDKRDDAWVIFNGWGFTPHIFEQWMGYTVSKEEEAKIRELIAGLGRLEALVIEVQ